MPALIGTEDGEDIPFSGSCSLGLIANNTGVIQDKAVSRRHPVVHFQGNGKHLLVDLGSTNGTLLNDHVLDLAKNVGPGDRIQVGEHVLELV